ncbi:MAG: TPM domain-containing protein [SAR324 cluster bacterium]
MGIIQRMFRHLWFPHLRARRAFPAGALGGVERAIGEAEASHEGEIRFALEATLPLSFIVAGVSPKVRAIEVFSRLRVWDTEHNSGVLIYVCFADRAVEIVADRGIHARSGTQAWERICRAMEGEFRQRRFESGAVAGIRAIAEELAQHFPATGAKVNELPDRPVVM